MTAAAHQPQPTRPETSAPEPIVQLYRAGDRVQILYMSERGTILADTFVTAVFARADGSYRVNAVMSDARASFHLVPAATADQPAPTNTPERGPGHVIYGVDHTKPTD